MNRLRCLTRRVASRTRPARMGGDTGSATLETAMSLPVLLLVAILMIWAMFVGMFNVRFAAAANDLARSLARGEVSDLMVGRVMQSLPAADVSIEQRDGMAHVSVRQFVSPGGVFENVGFTVEQHASAPIEQVTS